jgi:endo-1,3(4)-beta-glucanase
MKQPLMIAGIGLTLLLVLAGSFFLLKKGSSIKVSVPLVNRTTFDALPVRDGSSANTSHVASSIIPPTNSWLSGMVLQETPKAVYPMPLSFLAKESGFEIGLPTVTVNATAINGGHIAGIMASIDQATQFQLTRYDKISATLTYKDSRDAPLGRLTVGEGTPYVYYRALTASQVILKDITPNQESNNSSRYLRYTKADHDYVAVAGEGSTITVSGSTADIRLDKDGLVTFYALPDSKDDSLREYALNEVRSVITSHDTTDKNASTTLKYTTANNKPTVHAAMGYAKIENPGKTIASYQNIYGRMQAIAGNEFTTTATTVTPSNQLDLSRITTEHKQQLLRTLEDDVAKTKISAQDSYYAGKQLARAANLLAIAEQLDQPATVTRLKTIIKDAMAERLDNNYFYYDSKLKGIAATTKAFGSEDFNDHHFHYGYFIYAASILGKYDKQFLSDYRDKVSLLAADIASYDASDQFPVQRHYDAYAGHSWAAGLAPFADGNNQESSSEAMNAWNAVSLWGDLIDNSQLSDTGKWMLSNESATARNAWRAPPTTIPNYANYTSPITSLNFGGKLTYSTFFSDEANAKLGIQLISMNPFMTDLSSDGTKITSLVDRSITDDNFNVALADYILMYLSLQNPERALSLADKQQDAFIDDGNSRTYLNAFIFSQSDK